MLKLLDGADTVFPVFEPLLTLGAESFVFCLKPREFIRGRSEVRYAVRGHALFNVDAAIFIRKILPWEQLFFKPFARSVCAV